MRQNTAKLTFDRLKLIAALKKRQAEYLSNLVQNELNDTNESIELKLQELEELRTRRKKLMAGNTKGIYESSSFGRITSKEYEQAITMLELAVEDIVPQSVINVVRLL